MRKVRLAFKLLLIACSSYGQDTVQFTITDDHGLVDYQKNRISNLSGLDNFFEKLYKLKKEKQGQVNILHIGDSHIQADYQTNQLRQNFQREFGNAGRGFVMLRFLDHKIPRPNRSASIPRNYPTNNDQTAPQGLKT